jgi:hypothetical protein
MGKVIDANEKFEGKKLVDGLKRGGAVYITTKGDDGKIRRFKMTLKKKR